METSGSLSPDGSTIKSIVQHVASHRRDLVQVQPEHDHVRRWIGKQGLQLSGVHLILHVVAKSAMCRIMYSTSRQTAHGRRSISWLCLMMQEPKFRSGNDQLVLSLALETGLTTAIESCAMQLPSSSKSFLWWTKIRDFTCSSRHTKDVGACS